MFSLFFCIFVWAVVCGARPQFLLPLRLTFLSSFWFYPPVLKLGHETGGPLKTKTGAFLLLLLARSFFNYQFNEHGHTF